ncbi:hypothetical protein N9L92_04400 [Saprospiraceae bacterium]|nr:hypothetical protein [Saprospiraceae bacterium]
MHSLKSNFHLIIIMLAVAFSVTNCNDEETGLRGDEDAWISVLRSIDDDKDNGYLLGIDEDDNTIAISNQRILLIDKQGQLFSNTEFSPPVKDRGRTNIHNGKIYRFSQDGSFDDFDPHSTITLEIFDLSGGLLSTHIIDADGLIFDVVVENDKMVGIMAYNVDNSIMKVQKFHIDNGLQAEYVTSIGGTGSTQLYIAENGDYHCFGVGPYFQLDNDLNLKIEKEFAGLNVKNIKDIPGQGKFLLGTRRGSPRDYIIAFVNDAGEEQYRKTIDTDLERSIETFQINDEVICINALKPEPNSNIELMFFDFDFNLLSTVDIDGQDIVSNIILNDNDSFTLIYGTETDNASSIFDSRPRVFKFDKTYTIPTDVIEQ